jgi:flagellin-like protein
MRIRGISPVVATALLVLIAVATAALLYLWVSGTVSNQPTEEPALHEKIKIEAVGYDSGAGQVTIYVRNVGAVTANITSAYVIDAVTGKVVASDTAVNQAIPPGNPATITLNANLEAGKPYTVKVVTEDGVEATYILIVRQ